MTDIAAVSPSPANAAARLDGSRSRLVQSYETFLALLTTQLKNQDPTSPLDTNQFTQQLVQMTGVEQQLLTNDLLKAMAEKAAGGLSDAVAYIGRTVEVDTAQTGLAKDGAHWRYSLPSTAKSVTLEVLDARGQVVHRQDGIKTKGQHAFTWDGKALTGGRLPEGGTYTLRVTAMDAAGGRLATPVTVAGVVTAVEQADGESRLLVNGVAVPLTAVRSVRLAQAETQQAGKLP